VNTVVASVKEVMCCQCPSVRLLICQ